MTKIQQLFFELIQVAIGNRACLSHTPGEDEWGELYAMAEKQALVGVCFAGVERLHEQQQVPPIELLMDWLGQVEFAKSVYEEHQKAIVEMAKMFAEHGLRMMVLKGFGLSLNYPVPELRPCGDIDIFLQAESGDLKAERTAWKQGDEIIERLGIEVHKESSHHSTFCWDKGITVENHRTLMDQDNHKSNIRMEAIFQELLKEPQPYVEIDGAKIYYPSATLNAVYLLRHAGEHFATNEITMRHVLDVGFFFQRHADEIDWQRAMAIIEAEGMKSFYDVMATICTQRLGFKVSGFYGFLEVPELADKVLADIFAEKEVLPMSTKGIHGLNKIIYGIQKSKRFMNNRWKYKMVYKEGLLQSFCTLAMNRLK